MQLLSFRSISFPIFLLLAWFSMALICAMSLPYIIGPSLLDTIHSISLILNYGFIYLLPTITVCWLFKPWYHIRLLITTIVFTITIIFKFSDGRLYDLYGFHFNGFVWNLLITPGGFSSLGADQTSWVLLLKYLAILLTGLILCISVAYIYRRKKVRWGQILLLFLLITITERLIYGFAYANVYGPIMTQADHMLLYQPMKMNSLLTSMGYQVKKEGRGVNIDNLTQRNINYPLATLAINKKDQPYNIIFLVAESMRSQDIFNKRVMPHSVKFAREYGSNFTHHYSGGNGTRQGLFAMFYGLYGSYWDSFLRARQSPVFFDVLNQYDYEYFIYTGARFTYPEFDQTIFGSISSDKLIETNKGEPWKRDNKNVNMLLSNIEDRNKNRPFMGFVFFESTHARYSFPQNQAIEKDYLENLDYAGLSREELSPQIGGMKARYINSSHYLDSQFKRVYDYLIANNLLENTIVHYDW